jgi:hypothetical protein
MGVSVCNAVSRTQFTQNPCQACYDGQSMRYSGRLCLKNVIYATEIAWLFSGRREKRTAGGVQIRAQELLKDARRGAAEIHPMPTRWEWRNQFPECPVAPSY